MWANWAMKVGGYRAARGRNLYLERGCGVGGQGNWVGNDRACGVSRSACTGEGD